MRIVTYKKDLARVDRLIESENIQELKNIALLWSPEYRFTIYNQLSQDRQDKWNTLLT